MCLESNAPVAPVPERTWTTPFGNPASSNNGAMARDPKGDFSEGLHIMTFPVARHGAAFRMNEATGELYGFIAAHTL